MEQDLEQQGLVHGAAGAAAGGLLGRHPADDGGELFGAGHVRQQRVLLGRNRMVPGGADSDRFWAAMGRNLIFSGIILAIEIPLGIFIALNMPEKGLGRAGLPRADGAAAADPVERRRHDLAGFRRASTSACSATRINALGIDYNYVNDPIDAWFTVM
jgi:hypothetical protein